MSIRRSSRRLTITGSSVFCAKTPVVLHSVEEQNASDESPIVWVSAEKALDFKTPKFTRLTRRSTLTRQNIFQEVEGTTDVGFKKPTLFVVSPPGIKTRSRRSSIYLGNQKEQPNNDIEIRGPPTKIRKGNENKKAVVTKQENIVVGKTKNKSVKKTNEVLSSHAKNQSAASTKRFDKKSQNDTVSHRKLSPKEELKKKTRKSGRLHMDTQDAETSDSNTFIDVDNKPPQTQISLTEQTSHNNKVLEQVVESKTTQQQGKTKSQTPIHKPPRNLEKKKDEYEGSAKKSVTSKLDISPTPLAKSASHSRGLKGIKSYEDDTEEIDEVVKKMFSPSSFYSSKVLKSSHKYTSPNSLKSASSPARAAIMKETSELKSEIKSPSSRKTLGSSFTTRTPSRAAPKARKILGVATPTPNFDTLKDEQNFTKSKSEKKIILNFDSGDEAIHHVSDESMSSPSKIEDEIKLYAEDENNLTLSHTSHSQWCIIL